MAAENANRPAMLESSTLGTKEYWDRIYERELANIADDPDDEGTIWFADSGAEEKMLQYLEDLPLLNDESLARDNLEDHNLRVLDLGTGNGHLLFSMREEGWKAEMVGVDYSDLSIQLARRILSNRATEHDVDCPIQFEKFDILSGLNADWIRGGFHIVLDKGTFDAISLSDDRHAAGATGPEVYVSQIQRLVMTNGFLLVTSCNWTTDELRKWFDCPGLVYHGLIRYPSFTFGGQQGQSVSSVCFRKI